MKPDPATSRPPAGNPPVGRFPPEVDVCQQFAPRVRAIALRHLRDRSAADDIVQEVLVSVVLALREQRIEAPEHLSAYVLSTCRRRIADALRTDARRSALRDEVGQLGVAQATQSRLDEKRVDITRVVLALSPLSGRERQVLNETYSAERSAEEIAQSIGTTAGHVRVLRHRALAKMRAALGWEDA